MYGSVVSTPTRGVKLRREICCRQSEDTSSISSVVGTTFVAPGFNILTRAFPNLINNSIQDIHGEPSRGTCAYEALPVDTRLASRSSPNAASPDRGCDGPRPYGKAIYARLHGNTRSKRHNEGNTVTQHIILYMTTWKTAMAQKYN